ncbi:hypothetical protein [Paenibacillus sp. FSL H7-0331]|uniref:hypothetical protein n=1 Tax=Paenibacillus sp. FSL H7-0331 TaxID=1920421 RepID=UPI0015C3EDF9|nr:hypothetical protein [Paenibacillus sp. FSL H7-0331]
MSLFLLLDRVQIEQDLRGGNQVVVQLLHKLRIFKTAIDLKLPNSLSTVEFATFKSKADQEIQQSLLKLGFQ